MKGILLYLVLIVTFFSQVNAQCVSGNCINGNGKFVYKDQSTYEGKFKNRMADGYGVCRYSNGKIYEGEWKNHTYHGKGILTFPSGKQRSGQWVRGTLKESMKLNLRAIRPQSSNTQFASTRSLGRTRSLASPNRVIKKKTGKSPRIWAVLVGIASYRHMPTLNFTDDDAYKMYAFLKSPEGGALSDKQVSVIIDEGATKRKIISNMKRIFNQADSNDVILFYFSGHGEKNAFLPIDFDGYLNRLKHSEISTLLKNSKARLKICIADACHAGALEEGADQKFNFSKKYGELDQEIALMLSSKAEEVSVENAGLRQGIFTHFLIKGLKGAADIDENGEVTIEEVYEYVRQNVSFYTNNYQTPVLYGNFDKDLTISTVPGDE